MGEFNICRRQLNDVGESIKYCTGRITRANALDWCDKCRERLPFWPARDPADCTCLGFRGRHYANTCPHKPKDEAKHHAAFDRKTGEGQEHLGPRGIKSYVKADDFQETI